MALSEEAEFIETRLRVLAEKIPFLANTRPMVVAEQTIGYAFDVPNRGHVFIVTSHARTFLLGLEIGFGYDTGGQNEGAGN